MPHYVTFNVGTFTRDYCGSNSILLFSTSEWESGGFRMISIINFKTAFCKMLFG